MQITCASISVVYPVFNEAELVEQTIRRSIAVLEKQNLDFEIIAVDDGSKDATPEILAALAKEFRCLKVVTNEKNQGQGRSILNGFAAASKDYVIHNGIDYPFDLEHLPKLISLAPENDVVVATRTSYPGYPLARLFVSKINRILVRSLFGIGLKDCNFVQLYRAGLLRELPVQAKSAGFVTTELILLAHDSGFRIAQLEIPYEPREKGVPGNSRLSVVFSSFNDLMNFYFRRTFGHFRRPTTMRSLSDLEVQFSETKEKESSSASRNR